MKVQDLVSLSHYGSHLSSLYSYCDMNRKSRYNDEVPLQGIVVKVEERFGKKRYFIKWMKAPSPRGRDGSRPSACDFFERQDLKYVSKSK